MTSPSHPVDFLAELAAIDASVASLLAMPAEMLTHRPASGKWSAVQTVEHIVLTNRAFFPRLDAAIQRARTMGASATTPFRYSWLGQRIVALFEPPPKFRLPLPTRRIAPVVIPDVAAVRRAYEQHHEQFRALIQEALHVDMRRANVESPFLIERWLPLDLGTAIGALLAHERRHLYQASAAVARHPDANRVNRACPPSLELQPLLTGELITLRPLHPGDFDALYAVASDRLIWEQHPSPDRYKEDVFREFFREALASGGALIVLDQSNQHIIGSSRYHGYDPERREVEIGWTFLARTYWGGRYNGEMKRLMMEHAFRSVERIIFNIGTHNIRSQRAVERIGGQRVGTRTDPARPEEFVYEITASAYASARSISP